MKTLIIMDPTDVVVDDYHSRFIEGYCIILPNGHRVYPSTYAQYRSMRIWRTPKSEEKETISLFAEAEALETGLEATFDLPNEHLLGIHEVYPNIVHAATLAQSEHDRLLSARPVKSSDENAKPTALHLDLYLTTSLSRNFSPHFDLCKEINEEKRFGCQCMICIPATQVFLSNQFKREDLARLEAYLNLDLRTANLYIPFRQSCHRREVSPKKVKVVKLKFSSTP